jgi:hypothetical protein
MPVKFYMDAHFPAPITRQLRRRQVQALVATEQKTNQIPDDELLELASSMGHVVVTFDILFRVMAEDWIRQGRDFAGLVWVDSRRVTFGQAIEALELIAKVYEPSEMKNQVKFIPLR